MSIVSERIRKQIRAPQPNWSDFLAVIQGKKKPEKVYLAELFADQEIMQWITEHVFKKTWTPKSENNNLTQTKQHYLDEIDYWHRIGYDYILLSGGLVFPRKPVHINDTAELPHKQRCWVSSTGGPIQSWRDFEQYPWPVVKDENLWHYEFVANHLPDGMGLLICPLSGFLEVPLDHLIGYESLAMLSYDSPDLVKAVFDCSRDLITEVYRRLISIPQVTGCFQGDDMGFKTGLLMPPDFLKTYPLTSHQYISQLTHDHDKVYFLHSCGKLDSIMDYLIDEVRIDAKQSNEDAICPIEQIYDTYASRIGIIGGVDVHLLSAADETSVRERTKQIIEHCMPRGRFALGSGNSITNYCKPANVLTMLDEAYRWSGK